MYKIVKNITLRLNRIFFFFQNHVFQGKSKIQVKLVKLNFYDQTDHGLSRKVKAEIVPFFVIVVVRIVTFRLKFL
jgi:hypothetical protein